MAIENLFWLLMHGFIIIFQIDIRRMQRSVSMMFIGSIVIWEVEKGKFCLLGYGFSWFMMYYRW